MRAMPMAPCPIEAHVSGLTSHGKLVVEWRCNKAPRWLRLSALIWLALQCPVSSDYCQALGGGGGNCLGLLEAHPQNPPGPVIVGNTGPVGSTTSPRTKKEAPSRRT